MQILFVTEHYPPTEGGVATSAQRVARELVKLGVTVHVLCFDNSRPINVDDYLVEDADQGVLITRIGPFFLKQALLNADSIPEKVKATFRRRAFNQMVKVARKTSYDCVLSFYLLNAGFLARFLARELGLPCIVGVRGNDIGRNIFHVERFGVIQWVVTGADRIVCVNNHLRKRCLLAFPEIQSRTSVITNGTPIPVDYAPSSQSRTRLMDVTGWHENDFVLTFIGTLREKKGVVSLLKAVEMSRERSPIRLLVIGPEIGSIEKKLCGDLWARLKSENVLFSTAMLSRAEVKNWALGANAVVMSSTDDGLPNGLLEGMALGLCPIATEIFSDLVINMENGIVIPCNDAPALADAILLLSSKRELSLALGKKARGYIKENHSPLNEARAYSELLYEVASKSGKTNDSCL